MGRRDGDVGVLQAGGEIRLESAARLRETGERLLAEGARSLVVALRAVSFIDSASLAALIRLDQKAIEKGGRAVLAGVSNPVRRVLANSGLETRFLIVPDETAARALLAT